MVAARPAGGRARVRLVLAVRFCSQTASSDAMRMRYVLCGVALAAAGATPVADGTALGNAAGEQEDALMASLERKIAAVVENGSTDADPDAPRLTRITEKEINLLLTTRTRAPDGVTDPEVALEAEGRVTGRATVDLDAVRTERSGGWLDPRSYLTGRLPVVATAVIHSGDGVGRLEIERIEVAGVAMPTILLRELVSVYSKSSDNPEGIDLDRSYRLPHRIRAVRISAGEAVIVQ